MNDDDLMTKLREPFADLHMTVPAESVVHRGRVLRRQRRSRGLTGAVALAGGAAIAATMLWPGGQTETARLAAWTVVRQPDGSITISIRQLSDPAGLQAKLRADGVPVRVAFARVGIRMPLPAGCAAPKPSELPEGGLAKATVRPVILATWALVPKNAEGFDIGPVKLPDGKTPWAVVATTPQGTKTYLIPAALQAQMTEAMNHKTDIYLNPAAIPPGIGLFIGADRPSSTGRGWNILPVVVSPTCTGPGHR